MLLGTKGWRKFEWKNVLEEKDVRLSDQILYTQLKNDMLSRKYRASKILQENDDLEDFKDSAIPLPSTKAPQAIQSGVVNQPVEEIRKIKELKEAEFDQLPILEEVADRKKRKYYRALVRVFPVKVYQTTKTEIRNDFRETLYWAPRVKTDSFGNASVTFYLNDAISSFKVTAEGLGTELPGRGEFEVDSRLPLYSDIRMPYAFSAGDKIELPVVINNETDTLLNISAGYKVPSFMRGAFDFDSSFQLKGKEGKSIYLPFELSKGLGKVEFGVEASGLKDKLSRNIRVYPTGFPVESAFSGNLTDKQSFMINIPVKVVRGSVNAQLELYPSPTSSLLAGIEGMLREPHGCFEQTSSSTYPNIVILEYLRENEIASPAIEKRATQLIEKGYKRLTGFECKKDGYEWYGNGAAHDSLTAYGLMEFVDMARVSDIVDEKMIKRTAKWVLDQRDQKGAFKINTRSYCSFGGATREVTDAYLTWALTEAGLKAEVHKEIDTTVKKALESKDPYKISLALLSVINSKTHSSEKTALFSKLNDLKTKDGFYIGVGRSITSSSGVTFNIEATSLAVMAQLRNGTAAASLNDSVTWLLKKRRHGSFGSTQSTILALKALTEYAKASRMTQSNGDVYVKINGEDVKKVHFSKGQQGSIKIEGLEEWLNPGPNQVEITLRSEQELPFSMNLTYNTIVPVSQQACKVRMEFAGNANEVKVGDMYSVDVKIKNTTSEGLGSTLVRIGVPAGLEKNLKQLKELKKEGKIAEFETTAREVILHFRGMTADEVKTIPLKFTAVYPGEFTGKASSAYEYYTNDKKWWINPLQVKITR